MGSGIERDRLIALAWEARKGAYAPYSHFSVGAALLVSSGRIFSGANIENLSFGLTVCAERVAIASAVQAGEREFDSIVIVALSSVPVVPCGACRQVMAEFCSNLTIISEGKDGVRSVWDISELLPSPSDGILDR